jgi:hypothetical protein
MIDLNKYQGLLMIALLVALAIAVGFIWMDIQAYNQCLPICEEYVNETCDANIISSLAGIK